MGIMQYIGARYVPLFYTNSDGTEEWRAGVEYEPLTIVTWNMNSYTSKKPVPSTVGNPSDNPEYWVATGMFNAQIAALQTEVNRHEQDLYRGVDAANVVGYGATGDGVTDDSAAFTAAAATGKDLFIPAGTYVVSNISFTRNVHIIGAPGAVIRPKYINGIAQNVFTVTGADYAIFEDLEFSGVLNGATDQTVYRQSSIEVSNLDYFCLRNVTFRRIDDSVTAIESVFRNRKGLCITAWDVNNTVLDSVQFDGMGSEEICWITDHATKTTKAINVDIVNCSCVNMTRLSLFDIIANRINITGFTADETNNFQSFSMANLFGYYVNIEDSTFNAHCGDAVDTYEGGSFRPVMVNIKNSYFGNCRGSAIVTCCDVLNIENCDFEVPQAINTTSAPATNEDVIINGGSTVYTVQRPMDIINLMGCRYKATMTDGTWKTACGCLMDARSGAHCYVRNNIFDMAEYKGNAAWFIASATATVAENVLKNCGLTISSSNVKAFFEVLEDGTAFRFLDNYADDNYIFAFLAPGVDSVVVENNVIETGHYIAFSAASYKIKNVYTDTSHVILYADNYTGTSGGYAAAAWTAESANATLDNLTNMVHVFPGTYLLTCDVPDPSAAVFVTFKNNTGGRAIGEAFKIEHRQSISALLTFTTESDICVALGQSGSFTFSNIGTRGIKACKIC